MNSIRRTLSVLTLSVAATAAGIFGYEFADNHHFAMAKEQVEATRDQLNKAEDLSTVFRSVGKVVEPSVVNITVTKTVKSTHRRLPFSPDQLRKFFPKDENGDPQIPDNFGDDGGAEESPEQVGTGSGVIMDVDGKTAYILTNNHVAGGAEKMVVTLSDGREFKNAKLVGADPKADLAVVKIEADHLIGAKWGDSSQLQKGDWIMAFGSPFGYVGSMTHGIVSALDRTNVGIIANGQGYEDFIQVDAPINPGNSGGPLVNLHGEVVGVNTAIASRSGGFSGIGFAIPSNQAKQIYTALKEHGKVTRGWLGVSIQDVGKNLDLAKSFGFDGDSGVLVQQTFPGTPAHGKLVEGDIVTKLNGKKVDTVQQLRNTIASVGPNQDVKMTVFRQGKTVDVDLKTAEQPEDMLAAAGQGRLAPTAPKQGNEATLAEIGLKVSTVTDELAEKYSLGSDIKAGALVTQVTPRSVAARAGLRPGDLITQVGRKPVTDAQGVADAVAKADLKKGVQMYVASHDGSRYVLLKNDGQ